MVDDIKPGVPNNTPPKAPNSDEVSKDIAVMHVDDSQPAATEETPKEAEQAAPEATTQEPVQADQDNTASAGEASEHSEAPAPDEHAIAEETNQTVAVKEEPAPNEDAESHAHSQEHDVKPDAHPSSETTEESTTSSDEAQPENAPPMAQPETASEAVSPPVESASINETLTPEETIEPQALPGDSVVAPEPAPVTNENEAPVTTDQTVEAIKHKKTKNHMNIVIVTAVIVGLIMIGLAWVAFNSEGEDEVVVPRQDSQLQETSTVVEEPSEPVDASEVDESIDEIDEVLNQLDDSEFSDDELSDESLGL